MPRDSIVSVKSTLGKESNQEEVMKLQGEDIDDMTVNEDDNEDHEAANKLLMTEITNTRSQY